MWSEIVDLFSGYGVIPMIVILLGTLLLIIEIFIPGFGIFGIIGLVLTFGGIVARMLLKATLDQFLIMILSVASIVVLAIILMFLSAKFGLIKHSPLIEEKTSISVNYGADNKQLLKMLGKITFATTGFKPVGKFEFNGETYEASSYGEYIAKGEKVQIVEIQGDKIFVKKADGINGKTK